MCNMNPTCVCFMIAGASIGHCLGNFALGLAITSSLVVVIDLTLNK